MEVFEAAEFLQISSMGKACLKLIQEEGGPQQMEDLAYLISLSGIPEHQKALKGGHGSREAGALWGKTRLFGDIQSYTFSRARE